MGENQPLKPGQQAWRLKFHEIIFEAHTFAGRAFDILLLLAIVASIIAISMETVPDIADEYGSQLVMAEWFFTGLFTIEYILRIACVQNPRKYIFSFYGIVDLISILPSYVGLGIGIAGYGSTHAGSSFAIVRSLRLLRVFRILKIGHLLADANDLYRAIWQARGKIVVFLATVLIVVTIAGTLMYEIEGGRRNRLVELDALASNSIDGNSQNGDKPDVESEGKVASQSEFNSIPKSIYWAIVTMTTVGYGDMVATSTLGQFVTSILILVGYSLIIVPTGFMSAEFIANVKKNEVSNRSCRECMHEDHSVDAIYCNQCGTQLTQNLL